MTDPTRSSRSIEVINLPGLTPYHAAFDLQVARHTLVEQGEAGNTLLLVEHPPVITLGRNAHEENLLLTRAAYAERGITVTEANRGGDVTYHGPGQLVAYPILNLTFWRTGLRWYLRSIEEVLIRLLAGYGLRGERIPGHTGVWVDGAKVAAIGVGAHNWVTFHGTALNVNPDMSHFGLIVPCGIADKPVTSLANLLGAAPDMGQVRGDFAAAFLDYFEHWQPAETAES